MERSEVANSLESHSVSTVVKSGTAVETAANRASQEFVISSTNDEFQWCAEMDYQFACNSFRSAQQQKDIFDNSASQISFTSNSDSSVSNGRYKNFDINLAQIDIETFKSEDIERLAHKSYNGPMEDSADTLRIVESLRSLNVANDTYKHLQPPSDDCEALSVDSLDLSIDNEINAKLIQKCSKRDKTRYKIAMIDTSVHSQMQNSYISTNSDYDCDVHVNNNNYLNNKLPNGSNLQLNLKLQSDQVNESELKCRNPFSTSFRRHEETKDHVNVDSIIQSPGSLVQMFIQNKINSNENSVLESMTNNGNYINGTLSKCDINNCNNLLLRNQSQGGEPVTNYPIDEMDESTGNSLNTVDSNELPLHVLDLSKKLRSMNLTKQIRFGSTSVSSNTSFTSTTTSSSATTFDKRKHSQYSTNPFLQMNVREDKKTRTTSTQFPEPFQDKEVQASFEEDECKDAPVLVYYPNYSLPDLSFLQDIFKPKQPIYLSPVKHEPPKMTPQTSYTSEVNRRAPRTNPTQSRKSRPKSYADYETLLSQDFSHIKDWDSLNLLLPDDFKEFIEKNNLCRTSSNSSRPNNPGPPNRPYPIKSTLPSSRVNQVKLRSHRHPQQPSTKRYSLQEMQYCNYDTTNPYAYYPKEMEVNHHHQEANLNMTRSQTMPNCQFNPQMQYPSANSSNQYYQHHPCCHPCCHLNSNCHSPSFVSSQSSPQKPNSNFNWEMLSSSSFKKLLSFLSKLDECSDEHSNLSDSQNTSKTVQNSINDQKNVKNPSRSSRNNRTMEHRTPNNVSELSKDRNTKQPMTVPSKLDIKPKTSSLANKPGVTGLNRINSQSKATSPMTTNREVINRRANVPEKTKIILKRPTTLKSGPSSGIPVPKRTSSNSMIPIPKNTPAKDGPTKDRHKSGVNIRF